MPPAPTSPPRWPELDGLRCLAVVAVLGVHFAPAHTPHTLAYWGVRFFFVLSGFLITRGLLADRTQTSSLRSHSLRQFFIRRALRLWPLYFATLLVTLAFDVEMARALAPWNLTFTTNFFIQQHGDWIGVHSHLWSLAVEQQFYLIWPFLILFLPRRWLLPAICALIILAPALRYLEFVASPDAPPRVADLLLSTCADYFAWGALVAWTLRNASSRLPSPSTFAFLAVGLHLVHAMARLHLPYSPALAATEGTLLAAASACLIGHCIHLDDSPLKKLLRLAPLVYLGSISYGIYLIHNFAHWFGPSILHRLIGQNYFESELANVAWLATLSIALSALVWHAFEAPLARLGRRLLCPPHKPHSSSTATTTT